MNELLNELLTTNDYKNLSKFNLLLSKSYPDNFEHYVLNLLNDIFGFNHTIFLTYSNNGYVKNAIPYNVDEQFIEDYIDYYQKKDIIHQCLYNHRYDIHSEQVMVLSDVLEQDSYKNTKYLDFLVAHNFFYDMYLVINDQGDGIRILRERDKGKFTQNELEIGSYLCKVLASPYRMIQENRKFKDKIELFNKNMESMNFGSMMLSREFELINYNKLALRYSYDITGTYDINSGINDFKTMIYQESNDTLRDSYNHSFQKSIKSFIVEIISTIAINKDNTIDNYYIINIYNKIWFNRLLNKINYTKEKYNLTNREKEIVSLVSKGLSNKEIAENLYISIYTVKEHMKNISKKMNVNSRTAIISKLAI